MRNLRGYSRYLALFLLISLALWQSPSPAMVGEETQENSLPLLPGRPGEAVKDKEPQFVPGELIVKLKEGHTLKELDKLNQQFSVTSTEPVFKKVASPKETLKSLKDKLAKLSPEHRGWYWQLEKDSAESKEYAERIAKEKEELESQIKAQEELIHRLEERQKRAPEGIKSPSLEGINLLKTAKEANIPAMAASYSANPAVAYAEPNYIYRTQAFTNDADLDHDQDGQHNMDHSAIRGAAPIAGSDNTGRRIIVAVIDSGVDYTHEELVPNMWEDSTGAHGYDFFNGDDDPVDDYGHGTHVAGIIAAIGNNDIGVKGVSPQAKIMALKGHGADGAGPVDKIAPCFRYAVDNGANVLNYSAGNYVRSQVMEGVVNYAYTKGCIVVASAGNGGFDATNHYPSDFPAVIAIAATDPDGYRAYFSNFGPKIEVAAPGVDIVSLRAAGTDIYLGAPGYVPKSNFVPAGDDSAKYYRASGTSFACPRVAGLAALILARRPNYNIEDIRQVLRASADDVEPAGFDLETGFGRINVAKALELDSVLRVKITDPLFDSTLLHADSLFGKKGGMVSISGTAAGQGFREYRLSYRQLSGNTAFASDWFSLGDSVTNQVQQGVLGTWDVRHLSDGFYLLRLVATRHDGRKFSDVVGVTIMRSAQQLTSSVTRLGGLRISGKRIVWSEDRSQVADTIENDVFLFDLATQTRRQLTTGPPSQWVTFFDQDQVIWDGWSPPNLWDVYLYNISNNAERKITTDPAEQRRGCLAWSSYQDRRNLIVWEDLRNLHTTDKDLYLHDLTQNIERPFVIKPGRQEKPVASGTFVAWLDERNDLSAPIGAPQKRDIYLYDFSTGKEKRVTSEPTQISEIAIYGSQIASREFNNGRYDIYLYTLFTPRSPVTPGSLRVSKRRITTDVADIGFPGSGPAISGNLIVWADARHNPFRYDLLTPLALLHTDMYLYDLLSNTEKRLTWSRDAVTLHLNFDVSGNRITWYTISATDGNLYCYLYNRPPVLYAIPDKTGREGELLSFRVDATDPDPEDTPDTRTYSATNTYGGPLPAGITFTNGIFSWTPTFTQGNRIYLVTLKVTDAGGLSDTQNCRITIENVNRAPVLNAIGNKTVNESATLNFSVSATDPDMGDTFTTLAYSTTPLPAGATFTNGLFSWTPSFTQAGTYTVTFTAHDNGVPPLSAQETITITVNNVNRAPVLAAISNQTVSAGSSIVPIVLSATDLDSGDTLTYSVLDSPAGANFNSANRTFTWTPDHTQAGTYTVTFTVTDNGTPALSGSKTVTLTVRDVNRAPTLNPIGNQTVNEGQQLSFTANATDPDNDRLTWKLSKPGAGVYGKLGDVNLNGLINVEDFNLVRDASTGLISDPGILSRADCNGDGQVDVADMIVAGSVFLFGLDAGQSFNTATGAFSATPDYTRSGNYALTFTVSDPAGLTDEKTASITVNNVNRAPVLPAISTPPAVNENQLLTLTVPVATDLDGDTLTYSATNRPSGAVFNAETRVFSWTPSFDQGRTDPYRVTFTATDNGTPALSDTKTITITVTNVNRMPVISSVGNKTVNEGALSTFPILATDPDGDPLTYSLIGNPPAGASIHPTTGVFSWTPNHTQGRNPPYTLGVHVSDGSAVTEQLFEVTVNNVNRPPTFNPIPDQTVQEGQPLTFTVSATDPDGDPLTYIVYATANLPRGAEFNAATRTFTWTPDYTQARTYRVTFWVTDGQAQAWMDPMITVTNVNRAPVLPAISNPPAVDENQLLTLTVPVATDPDNDTLTYSATDLPAEAAFNVATRVFSWTPTYNQGRTAPYIVTFKVTDAGGLSDTKTVSITVNNVPRAPRLRPIGNREVYAGQTLSFAVKADNPDGDNLVYGMSRPGGSVIPFNAFNFVTGHFSWTPDRTHVGTHTVTFSVSNSFAQGNEETVQIKVLPPSLNRPPTLTLTPSGDKTVNEGQQLSFTANATDPDPGDTVSLGLGQFNLQDVNGDGFIDGGDYRRVGEISAGFPATEEEKQKADLNPRDGEVTMTDWTAAGACLLPFGPQATHTFNVSTGAVQWTPGYDKAGSYTLTFHATDNGTPALTATQTITLTVNNVNRLPVIGEIAAQTVNEGQLLTVPISITDPDGDPVTAYLTPGIAAWGAVLEPVPGQTGQYLFKLTPSYDYVVGRSSITGYAGIRARDNLSEEVVARAFQLTVNNVNRAPVIDPVAPQTVNEGQRLDIPVSVNDPDGDAITHSFSYSNTADRFPNGISRNNTTGALFWTPGFDQADNYAVTVQATDNGTPNLSVTLRIPITVNNVNRAPTLNQPASVTEDAGRTISFTASASDPDRDTLSFSLTGTVPSGASINSTTGAFTWPTTISQIASHTLTVKVQDSGSPALSDSKSFTITVQTPPPSITSAGLSGRFGGNFLLTIDGAHLGGTNARIELSYQQLELRRVGWRWERVWVTRTMTYSPASGSSDTRLECWVSLSGTIDSPSVTVTRDGRRSNAYPIR